MSRPFCTPVLRRPDATLARFTRLTLGRDGDYSERDIQNLLDATRISSDGIKNSRVGLREI